MYRGNGGYSWETVYSMPVWLRNFTFRKIKDYIERQDEGGSDSISTTPKYPKGPNVAPTYVAKAPTK